MSDRRHQRLAEMALVDATMQQAVEALHDRRVPICFEQVALVPERAQRLADGRVEYESTHFSVAIPDDTEVTAALELLCGADPDYTWEEIGARPTPVVYPTRDSALSWPVPVVDWAGMDWIEAIQGLGLDEHAIALFPRGLERQPRVVLPASMAAETVARPWLAAAVDHVSQGRYWTLGGVVGHRSLVIGQVAGPDQVSSA